LTPTATAERAAFPIQNPGLAVDHRSMANAVRALAMDAVQAANSGHPGMPMGMADVATVLFTRFLKFDPVAPDWPDRDRFVLSAGHGSMLLYALLHLTGYRDLTIDQLRSFRQWGSLTAGHPEYGHTPGVETTTGPLGQGLATAVGMALAERMIAARFGSDSVDHKTYALCGDGCLMEGISHEAISLAGHLRLSKLIVLFDDNAISIDGPTSLSCSDDQIARFAAAGWAASQVDGHDPDAVAAAIENAQHSDRPSFIACRTIIGFGAPNKQGSKHTHGSPLGAEEVEAAREMLGWPYAPFEIPQTIVAAWREAGSRGAAARREWQDRMMKLAPCVRRKFEDAILGAVPIAALQALDQLRMQFLREQPKRATRQVSQSVLNALIPVTPNLAGGSADLTSSNLTQAKAQQPVDASDFAGSYIHFGIREHGMAAALNGMALHGGFIPYGGTFLVFSDYSRPAIRLAALMRLRVIHVMTHDSIGLGEDGPTHQPVEHLASLRAIPNLLVLRPADAVETVEAWELALESIRSPSVLCLTRQAVAALPRPDDLKAGVVRGAYVLHEPAGGRDVTLIGTGSEVALALAASRTLAEQGIRAAVVSAPCFTLFAQQTRDYRQTVLGSAPRIGIEAAIEGDWARWLGPDGVFIGMTGFGASAPAERLYAEFGITSDALVRAARDLVGTPAQRG
jgi:transketolase